MRSSKRHSSVDTPERSQRSDVASTATAAPQPQTNVLTPAQSVASFESLPSDALATILSYLTPRELLKCMLINHWWKQQITMPANTTIANAVYEHTLFRWRAVHLPARTRHGVQLQPVSLPNVRRLRVDIKRGSQPHSNMQMVDATSVCEFTFILQDVTQRCGHLTDLTLYAERPVNMPRRLHLPASLRALTLSRWAMLDFKHIAPMGHLCPHLTTLRLMQIHLCVEPADLCSAIGQSLTQLQTLTLPKCMTTEAHVIPPWCTDEHLSKLAPLHRLQNLSLMDYCDTTLTLQPTWKLESLQLVASAPPNGQLMVLQGAVNKLETLVLHVRDSDGMVQSLVDLGVASTLKHIVWHAELPTDDHTVQLFSQFTSLKSLVINSCFYTQRMRELLDQLECPLDHLHLISAKANSANNVNTCLRMLPDIAVVQKCPSLGLPTSSRMDFTEMQQLLHRLPNLRTVYCDAYDDNDLKVNVNHLLEMVKRPIKLHWISSYKIPQSLTHSAAAKRAFHEVSRT